MILVTDKAGFEVRDRNDAHALFSCLSGTGVFEIERAAADLAREFGVLEWNDRFGRYEIISDAVPRSAFNRFLDQKAKEVPSEKAPDLFVKYIKRLANLHCFELFDPEFSNAKDIRTAEWHYKTFFSNEMRIDNDLRLAVQDWKEAVGPDTPKGQLIYYYLPADSRIDEERDRLERKLREHLRGSGVVSRNDSGSCPGKAGLPMVHVEESRPAKPYKGGLDQRMEGLRRG